ncbi:anti-sigma factor [Actinomadura rubrisoli]|uniref:WD40 repeat domain-containing protein n=1 Tax=Actinomadura rubrisoli TaxID=2530368 RepID=A0A4R5BJW0_9ACTN|nr:anti-sigma factor [Actinomadura rubrisoli]TDD85633.1 hypothetical protein E1298_18450 [Actinomadura rubrisoli]
MTDIENRLRDALRATADTVDEAKPRPLPEHRRSRAEPNARGAPLRGWVLPLCAVAAILVMIAGLLGIRQLVGEPDRRLQKVPTMPRFLFASYIAEGRSSSRVEVHDSRTGRVMDAKQAPAGMSFEALAAAGDNRTLFVFAKKRGAKQCRSQIMRISVSASGKIVDYRPLAGSAMTGRVTRNGAIAVTEDGRKLAYAIEACLPEPTPQQSAVNGRIGVIDTATGARREWRESQGAGDSRLSWSSRGDLLFFVRSRVEGNAYTDFKEVHELRSLPVTRAGGGRLAQVSHDIRHIASPRAYEGVAAYPDGRRVLVFEGRLEAFSGNGEPPTYAPEADRLKEISADDGRVLRSIRLPDGPFIGSEILKVDASGGYLITGYGLVDLAKGGTAIQIRGVSGFFDLDW